MRRRNPADSGPELLQEFAKKIAVSDNFSRLSVSLDEAAFMLADFAIRTLGPLVAKEAQLSWAVKALRDHTPVTDAASATKARERARYAADYVLTMSEVAQGRRPRECADALRAIAEVCSIAEHKPHQTADACIEAMAQTERAGVSTDVAVNAARRFLAEALRPKPAPKEKTVEAGGSKSSIMGTLRGLFSPAASARAANPSKINARVVNRALTKAGIPVTVYKSNGYFYYEAADIMLDLDSTDMCYWDDLTLDEWVLEVGAKYDAALGRRRRIDGRQDPRGFRVPRIPNPHYEAYYNHPSVKDHVALSLTSKGRAALAKNRGSAAEVGVLAFLAEVPSLPQFAVEGELGVSSAVLSSLAAAGLISATIEAKPARSSAPTYPTYTDDDHNLEYQHREMLRRGRTPNHHRTGLIGDDYPIDPYRPDLDTAFDPYDRDWRTPNPRRPRR